MIIKSRLLEYLAALEHDQWISFVSNLFLTCKLDDNGNLIIPRNRIEVWKLKFCKYQFLSKGDKWFDLQFANDVIKLLEREGIKFD